MSKIICMILCVLCAEIAVGQGMRLKRAATATSGAGSASSSSSSSSGSGGGGAYSSSGPGPNIGSSGGNFMFPTASLHAAQAYANANPAYAQLFHQQVANLIAQQQAAMSQFPFAFPGVDSNTITPETRFGGSPVGGNNPNSVFTSSQVSFGPQGGYGQASAFPGGPDGLGTRIAEEFPSPSGGSFGVFSSSSSSTSDVNGKRTSFKSSTFGTNDNGKITFRTINE